MPSVRTYALRLTLWVAVFSVPHVLHATNPIHIGGTVVTDEDSPIAGAVVSMAASEDEEISALTDENGEFSIEFAAEFPIVLHVAAPGFSETLVIWEGTEPLRVVLAPLSSADYVTVTASLGTRICEARREEKGSQSSSAAFA